jgi:hypothetical protein
LKLAILIPMIFLSACSWFHRKPAAPEPTQLVVTGAPAGAVLFVDGVQAGQEKDTSDRPRLIAIAPGMHVLEVRTGEKVSYRENTYVAPGERHVVIVLSGTRRE